MKLITQEQIDASGRATAIGGLKGALLGSSLTATGLFFAGKRYPIVARQPPVQKGWLILVGTLLFGATNAEFAYEDHMRAQWKNEDVESVEILEKHKQERANRASTLTTSEKVILAAKENRFKFVVGSWFASMVGSGAYIWARNPMQSFSQKLVQARMAAQVSTLGVLIATAGLSQIRVRGEEDRVKQKHASSGGDDWKYIVEEEEQREKLEEQEKQDKKQHYADKSPKKTASEGTPSKKTELKLNNESGANVNNLKSLWAGWRDSNLSNHGMNQARRLGESFQDYPIKAIIASDLTRARWTAEQIRDHNKTQPQPSFTLTHLLREQNFGKGEGQPWQQAQWQRKSGRDFKFQDGESLHDVANRAEEVIDNMIMPYVMASAVSGEESNVVVVAHGILIAELQYALLKRRPQGISAFQRSPLENTGWHRIEIKLATPAQSKVVSGWNTTDKNDAAVDKEGDQVEQQETLVEGPPDELNMATPITERKEHVKFKKLDIRYSNISEAEHLDGLVRAKTFGSMAFDDKQKKITDMM
ncbi:hypothetical protein E3P99_02975 [Wallemia hederae]|uniref:HIG1 domain-containing protein n=1 Tax=Wallemia hederae TaxID=1540922 RepID=A0A4T0FH88_9BASI|nr:hypothetical protein E3P99_02975 [Wallemia hederae]